jgi:hypothetical protein
MKASELLKAALAKLGPNGEHWVKKHYAVDNKGHIVSERNPYAVCWCSAGALNAVGKSYSPVWVEAMRALERGMGGVQIVRFNDRSNRKFPSVRRAFERAIHELEGVGA